MNWSNILENLKKITNGQKILIVLGLLFIVIVIYCIINRDSLINLQKDKENGEREEGFKTNKPSFNLYYVDWCGHCKTTKPEFKKLLSHPINKKVNIGMINCDKNPEEAEKEKINGFPTIKLINSGNKKEYNGERNLKGFLNFLKKHL